MLAKVSIDHNIHFCVKKNTLLKQATNQSKALAVLKIILKKCLDKQKKAPTAYIKAKQHYVTEISILTLNAAKNSLIVILYIYYIYCNTKACKPVVFLKVLQRFS